MSVRENVAKIEGKVFWEPRIGGGGKVLNFALKVPTGRKDYTSTIKCVAWASDFKDELPAIEKDDYVRAEGRIVARSYENKEGVKVEVTEIVCDVVEKVKHKSGGSTAKPAPKREEQDEPSIPF